MKTATLYLLITITWASILCFWKLGEHPLEEWDESRYGLNAYEMMQTGDFVNYYYEKEPDQWNAKPPLSIWLIVVSYKLFGYNEFALRFPSALAGVLTFAVFFYIVSLFYSLNFSLIACLILMSTKAIIGSHVARTGDMDSLFVLFTLLSIYFFIRYLKEEKNFIFLAAIFLGLSFYVKGFTFVLVIPGLLFYLILIKKFKWFLLQNKFWFSLGIFIVICSSWYFLQKSYGNIYDSPHFIGKNNWETMWRYDIVGRFFDYGFEEREFSKQYSFIISNLDVKFNLWNYIFYAALIILLIKYRRGEIKFRENELLLLSLCMIISISFILTFSQNKRPWYIAPMIPFVAVVTTFGIKFISEKKYFIYLIVSMLAFTLIRQFIIVNKIKVDESYFVKQNKDLIQMCNELIISPDLPQNIKLYSYWYNKSTIKREIVKIENDKCYLSDNKGKPGFTGGNCYENYCLILSNE